MRYSSSPTHPGGFTLIEVLIVIAITAALAALLLPVISRVRFQVRNTVCASQLHQWGLALLANAHENRGLFLAEPVPPSGGGSHDLAATTYDKLISDWGLPTRIHTCPHILTSWSLKEYEEWSQGYAASGFVLLGYGYWVQRTTGGHAFPPTAVACPQRIGAPNPKNVPLMCDSIFRDTTTDVMYGGHRLHGGSPPLSNQLFTDGRVSAVTDPASIQPRYSFVIWEDWR